MKNSDVDSYIVREFEVYNYKFDYKSHFSEEKKISSIFDTLIVINNKPISKNKSLFIRYYNTYDSILKKHWLQENVLPKRYLDVKNGIDIIPINVCIYNYKNSIYKLMSFTDYGKCNQTKDWISFIFNPRLGLYYLIVTEKLKNSILYKLKDIKYYSHGKVVKTLDFSGLPFYCDTCKYNSITVSLK